MPEEQTIDELHEEIERLRDQVKTHNGHPAKTRPEPEPDQQEEPPPEEKKPEKPIGQRTRLWVRMHPVATAIGLVALIAMAIGGVFLLRYLHSYESTDDAFVEGHLNPITPRIGGAVIAVHVENNQFVRAG